jgi:hypothetical protein
MDDATKKLSSSFAAAASSFVVVYTHQTSIYKALLWRGQTHLGDNMVHDVTPVRLGE